jgi:hypothetical protein
MRERFNQREGYCAFLWYYLCCTNLSWESSITYMIQICRNNVYISPDQTSLSLSWLSQFITKFREHQQLAGSPE